MTYHYHYAGEQAVELPTHHINTEGKDKDFVYETTEPITHPEFVLVADQATEEPRVEEAPQEEEKTQEEIAPETQTEEVQQTENVSEGEVAQVE